MTQQNASLVEESAAASQSLREQASLLLQSVSVFTLAADSRPLASLKPAVPAAVKSGVTDKADGNWKTF